MRDIAIVIWWTAISLSTQLTVHEETEVFLTAPSSAPRELIECVSLTYGRLSKMDGTLHEASMLCMVTQIDTTLRTGDHSLPKMDAHIYKTRASMAATEP